jgi:hypothetical protein
MAGRGPQTFLKRQKEQKRAARALAKREAKQARRNARSEEGSDKPLDEFGSLDDFALDEPNEQDPEPEDGPAN